jgi:hypothetical protein
LGEGRGQGGYGQGETMSEAAKNINRILKTIIYLGFFVFGLNVVQAVANTNFTDGLIGILLVLISFNYLMSEFEKIDFSSIGYFIGYFIGKKYAESKARK